MKKKNKFQLQSIQKLKTYPNGKPATIDAAKLRLENRKKRKAKKDKLDHTG